MDEVVVNDINKMPPKCQYCPYWEVCKPPYVCPDIGDKKPKRTDKRTEIHACDCISRQAAIDAVTPFDDEYRIRDAIEDLPSAQPERKRGRWLPDNRPGGGFWVCSCCKFPSEAFAADKLYKYCPVCGCRMDEGD